jgi:response regulator of citrate/malate metabolism
VDPLSQRAREGNAANGGPGVITVLVVDDDFMVAKVHRGFVERIPGFVVSGVAHTGAEALSEVERTRPDLVLLDIYLPDQSGLDVLRQLREADAPVDVLAITAARDVDTVRAALRNGVVHYLIKPFTFDVLRDRLERYASAHRRLTGPDVIAQDDVDRIFGALRPTRSELPKGLTAPTAELVCRALRRADGDLSAPECADLAGLSRVSTRRYLEYLVAVGKAEVGLRYGGRGRTQPR